MSGGTLTAAHVELLAGVDLFARLDRVALARLAACVDPVTVPAGQAVCRQGDPGDGLYVVVRGAFGVFVVSEKGLEARVGISSAGEFFGEMALLTGEPRSATIRAETDGEVLLLERQRFLDLLHQDPAIAIAIAATLSRRLRDRDRVRLQGEHVTARMVEQVLAQLPEQRRRRVLEASILDEMEPGVLTVLFGDDAAQVERDLEATGMGGDAPASIRDVLRRHLVDAVGEEGARQVALESARTLIESGEWDAALSLHARHAPRPQFLTTLARALETPDALPAARADAWLGHVAEHETAAYPVLARATRSTKAPALPLGAAQPQLASDASSAHLLGPRWGKPQALGAAAGAALVAGATGVHLRGAGLPWTLGLLIAAATVLITLDVLPSSIVGIGLLAAWVLVGAARPAQAALGFASTEWLFVLCVLALSAAIARSGLVFRVGLLLVRRMPRGLFWEAGALLLTGVLLSPLVPQDTGRAAITTPLALAVAEALKLRDREPAAAILGLAAWLGTAPLMFLFLNASSYCLLAWSLLPADSRAHFDWLRWLTAAAPLGAIVAAGSLASLFFLVRPDRRIERPSQRIDVQLSVLGPLSRREWGMVAVLLGTLAGWTIAPAFGVDIGVVAAGGLVAATVAGCFDQRTFGHLDWDYLLFCGVALSLTGLLAGMGFNQAAAQDVGLLLDRAGIGPLAFVLLTALASLLARLVLDQTTVLLLFGLGLIPVAPTLGVDPWIVAITLLATSTGWFLMPQTDSYIVAYSTAEWRLFSQAQARRLAFAHAGVTLVGLALSVPYWHMLGLLQPA